jgi:hypothetical protein
MRRNIALVSSSQSRNVTMIKSGKGTYSDIGLRESTGHQVLAQPKIPEFDIIVRVQEDCKEIRKALDQLSPISSLIRV